MKVQRTVQYIRNLVKCKMNGGFSYNRKDFDTMRSNKWALERVKRDGVGEFD